MNASTLSKRDLRAVQGIPMTWEDQPFVAVPLTILKDLLKRPAPGVPSSAVPVGSVDARAFARRAIAGTLKKARATAGLTQADLAKAMRISQARVSQAENGTEPVSVAFVKRWLKACNLPEGWKA
jgi:DNA-binding XRE family transcriptional regulator